MKWIELALAVVLLMGAAGVVADDHDLPSEPTRFEVFLQSAMDTSWSGPAELWTDPMGNEASVSEATMMIDAKGFSYTWSHDGEAQEGELELTHSGAQWRDSWHQPEGVALSATGDVRSLLAMNYSYPAGSGPDWGWEIRLTQRPDSTLVLAMTNITPWGEQARAVRMILSPTESSEN